MLTAVMVAFAVAALASWELGAAREGGDVMTVARDETARDDETPPGFGTESAKGNLYFVRALIERSSAAKRVIASGDSAALAKREAARDQYETGRKALEAGDEVAAQEALARAKQLMFAAARLADDDAAIVDKHRADYESRLDSVEALLAAHERVAAEKGRAALDEELQSQIEERLGTARTLAEAGRYEAARTAIDSVYLSVKASIESLRGGDTLVRSLDFSTDKEEYEYELDRNETLQMLVQILLEDKLSDPSVASKVDPLMEKARTVRSKAEEQAAAGDHEAAIESLESSTGHVIRAIRSAGVYVPG